MRSRLIRSWWWLPMAALIAMGAYVAAIHFIAPKVLRSLATKYVAEELGKTLTLGEVRADAFQWRLDVQNIRIDDDGAPILELQQLLIDLDASSLWRKGFVFDEVRLDSPFVRMVLREDGSLNLADLLPQGGDPGAPLPEISIHRLDVLAGRVDFSDHTRSNRPGTTLTPIEFHLSDFQTAAKDGAFQLTASGEHGAQVDWQGRLSLQPLSSEGNVSATGLQAGTAQAFFGDDLPFTVSRGSLDLSTHYRLVAAPDAELEIEASVSSASIKDLSLRMLGEESDAIAVPEASIGNARLSWRNRNVAIDTVHVSRMSANIHLESDGTLDVARMLGETGASHATQPADTPGVQATTSDRPWSITLARLEFRDSDATLQDRSVRQAPTFRLQPLSAKIADLSLDLSRPLYIEFDTVVNGAAPLAVKGTITPLTTAATLDVALSKLPLRDVDAYLPVPHGLRLRSGEIAANGRLVVPGDGSSSPELLFEGSGTLSGFSMIETKGGAELLAWRSATADGLRYSTAPDALSIQTLTMQGPTARVEILPDGSINLANALTPGSQDSSLSMPMPIDVGKVVLHSGHLGFSDYSIEPNFSVGIDALHGTVRDISTSGRGTAKIDLNGHVINRHSPVEISGETDPFAFDRHTDVLMTFRNIELPIFNPYSGRFAGYAIAKGKLTTELRYRIDSRVLAAEHHVVIDQLEWGDATESKDKVTLPVRLATSLLKDRHGTIDLDLPVNGTLDNPEFRIGPIVWQVVKNIITKAVTAPFSMLGGMFSGADDAQYIDFTPGSIAISEKSAQGLRAISQALSEKQELKIDIPGAPASGPDAEALRDRRFHGALAALSKKNDPEFDYAVLEPSEKLDLLKKLYREQFGTKPQLDAPPRADDAPTRGERIALRDQYEIAQLEDRLQPRFEATTEELTQLARDRAVVVQDALLADGAIDPARIFLATDLAVEPNDGMMRMELHLK